MAKNKDPMPHHISPMLARLTDRPFSKKDWIFEIKWDGYRAITEIEKGKIKLYSRNGISFVDKYPPIVKALQKIKYNCVLDGEIIALRSDKPDFHTLQQYEDFPTPLQYAIFDLLYLDGHDLRNVPLRERKALLKKLIPKSKELIFSEHIEEKGEAFFKTILKKNIEGMVAKDAQSPYLMGKRSDAWLKVKSFKAQEAVIVGFTKPRGSRKNLGALVLAANIAGELRYIGHSGGGFTQKELRDICKELTKIKVTKSPIKDVVPINSPITWVKPKYVCEVQFSEWTPEGRMRHPIYAGMRIDKKPSEVTREMPDAEPHPSKRSRSTAPKGGLQLLSNSSGEFSNLTKVFWQKEKYTKGDVIEYYSKIADMILPYLKDRPENLNRHPNGIKGQNFYQKDFTAKTPEFVETTKIWSESNGKHLRYLMCQNKETLLYLANLGCIELNPWNSRIDHLDKPDYMIIDLDPGDNTFNELVTVALEVHKVLEQARMENYIKTSGKTGLHIFVPCGAKYTYDEVKNLAQLIAQIVHNRLPAITSIERDPKKRATKIYLDYLQNRKAQTLAAPYSLRPYPGATVSTPLEWKEIKKGLDPSKFTIRTIFKRLQQKGDLWKPVLTHKVDLPKALPRLQEALL